MFPMIDRHLAAVATALSSDARTAARTARQLGLAGLLLDVRSSQLDLTQLSQTGRRELRQVLASNNVQLAGVRMDLSTPGLIGNTDIDRQIDLLDSAMESAAGLRAPLICVDLGALPAAPAQPPRAPISPQQAGLIIIPEPAKAAPAPPATPPDPAAVAQVGSALAEIGRRADRYGTTVAFSSSLASFASLNQVLIEAHCTWFAVDFDPLAALGDAWNLDEILSAVGPLIRHVQARDGKVGEQNRIKPAPIGRGDVNWNQLLSSLEQSDYRGFITLNPLEFADRIAAVSVGIQSLRAAAK